MLHVHTNCIDEFTEYHMTTFYWILDKQSLKHPLGVAILAHVTLSVQFICTSIIFVSGQGLVWSNPCWNQNELVKTQLFCKELLISNFLPQIEIKFSY